MRSISFFGVAMPRFDFSGRRARRRWPPIADGVDRSPCAAYLIRNNFKHGRAAKNSQRLSRWIAFTLRGRIKSLADLAPNFAGETAQVSPA